MQEKRFSRKPKRVKYFIAQLLIDRAGIVDELSGIELYKARNNAQLNRVFQRFEEYNGRGGYQFHKILGNANGYATRHEAIKDIQKLEQRRYEEKQKAEREKILYCH